MHTRLTYPNRLGYSLDMDKTTSPLTTDQLRAQYAENALQLRRMLRTAETVAPKKYRGYTVEQLRDKVATFTRLSTASDADLLAHLAETKIRIRERLAALKSAHVS